jgi:hypothetical protein
MNGAIPPLPQYAETTSPLNRISYEATNYEIYK